MQKWVKTIDIIKELQAKGYNVKYSPRKDTGYLIKSINGMKYTGAKGNTAARKILGEQLPTSLVKARKRVTKKRESKYSVIDKRLQKKIKEINKFSKKWGIDKPFKNRKEILNEINKGGKDSVKKALNKFEKENHITEDLDKQFTKTLRAWNKSRVKGKMKREITLAAVKSRGIKEVKKQLKSMERYAKGYVNNKNLMAFIGRLKLLNTQYNTNIFDRVIKHCKLAGTTIKDSAVMDAYIILYKLSNRTILPSETIVNQLIEILKQND